jgi:N-acetyltransferase
LFNSLTLYQSIEMTHPIILEGHLVTLRQLMPQHLNALELAASDPVIWQDLPIEGWRKEAFWAWAMDALDLQMRGLAHVFAVFDNKTGAIVGTTRFQDMDAQHCKTDIGWTWYTPSVWGRGFNYDAKNLMLTHAFETWQVQRIGFKVDERNRRSQLALEKIGATREGFFRNHMIRPDGSRRNSYFYGITDEDWFGFAKDKIHNAFLDTLIANNNKAAVQAPYVLTYDNLPQATDWVQVV